MENGSTVRVVPHTLESVTALDRATTTILPEVQEQQMIGGMLAIPMQGIFMMSPITISSITVTPVIDSTSEPRMSMQVDITNAQSGIRVCASHSLTLQAYDVLLDHWRRMRKVLKDEIDAKGGG